MNSALQQWLRQLEWILNHIDVGIHLVDSRGATVFYNQTMAEIDGIDPEHALGKHVFQLFPSLTDETSTLNHVLQTGEKVIEKTQTYVNIKGKQITTINSTYPLYDDGGCIVGAVEIARDITKIVALHDQVLDLRKQLTERVHKNNTADTAGTALYHFSDLVGNSPLFKQAIDMAKKASRSQSPVILHGDTGTGKDLLAQSIHNAGIRRDKPFIAQNCAAVPRELMEGILFGTTRGAFTGAVDRPGIFEQADGGTLFLDELNSLDLGLQSKLLRVLQDGRIRRVGATQEKRVDVRIIAAMNISPLEALEKGVIRSDLFYRLNVVNIQLPSLSRRREDIPLLIKHFIEEFNDRFGYQVEGIHPATLQTLLNYHWPGNVRELRHAVESAYNMIDADCRWIEQSHLPAYLHSYAQPRDDLGGPKDVSDSDTPPPTVQNGFTSINLPDMLEQIERDTILSALREHNWNISHTAEALGLKRQSLQYKMNKYQLEELK